MISIKGRNMRLYRSNGCGKSTLLKIITGLYTEFEGDLEVNGIKMKELDWDKLRKEKFSVVPQRLYLSSDSVIEFLEKGLAKSKKIYVLHWKKIKKNYQSS
ncbi:MAG: ATP-binding cassette domain-containing protein [Blautia wexlerae]